MENQPEVKIAIEPFTLELAAEITPLGQECWDECSEIKKDTCAYHGQRGLPIDPNNEMYLQMQSNNALIAMTLRDETEVLRGYTLMILYYSMHLRREFCCNVDTFYVQPAYRQFMTRFRHRLQDECRARGVSIIGWPVTLSGLMFKILKNEGYIADDVIMELKLKDLPGEASCA